MANLSDIKRYLSGGASNSEPKVSFGGAISSTQIKNQTATRSTSLITGVTIDDAAGNAIGTGTLSFNGTGKTLTWAPPNSTSGTAVDVSVSGTYAIQGPSNGGYVSVTVVGSSLPGSSVSDSVAITALANALWDDVSKAESNVGSIEYRCEYFKNTHASDSLIDFKVWISENTPGQDSVAIGLDDGSLSAEAVATTKSITGATWLSDVTTFTCNTHGIPVGANITVAGMTPSGYNGTYVVTAADTNTFSVADAVDPGTFSVGGTVSSETFAPTGVVFSTPTSAAPLTIGDMAAAAYKGVWIRRTVPAGVTTATASNYYKLGFSCKV
jgi:hypothetical protein